MLLKELGSSVALVTGCCAMLYMAMEVTGPSSGETKANGHRIALSASAAHYIYMRQ
jgi:hypothetical protein